MAYKSIITSIQKNSPLLMGILNCTPDSFSDGGQYNSTRAAIEHGWNMYQQGATLIDIGGESSRPGADVVSLPEELRRVLPVIKGLVKKRGKQRLPYISIDTYKPEVAAIALRLGADIVNDITGLRDPAMRQVVATENCPVILMHMQGNPKNMQKSPRYKNVTKEINLFFKDRIILAQQSGIKADQIILDPGIGFGKSLAHNIEILHNLKSITQTFAQPILIGVSRKSFIEKLARAATKDNRLAGTLAANLWSLEQGANILRVHDIVENQQAITIWKAITTL